MASSYATLLTGGSGFLGGLAAAALLAEERRRLILPIRQMAVAHNCLARIRSAILDRGVLEEEADNLMRLVSVVQWPPFDRLSDLDSLAHEAGIEEIVHCAGCVDYFDRKQLQLVNVELTVKLIDAARRWKVRRFFYLSTAYCSGYRSETIPERLHYDPSPANEPTEYTRSKRTAEWRVADSGLPFVIIRPSVVIGHSRTGKYTGKNYGLYQMWRAIEGLLCREYYPIWYIVAPPAPLDFIHQDAFETAFLAIYRSVSPDAIVHLVANPATRPTIRQICWQWADVYWPVEIHGYARVDDVPLRSIPARQRRFLELTAKNFEIATHAWNFETGCLDGLRRAGITLRDATIETIACCQRRYIEGSPLIQEHRKRFAGGRPRFIEMSQSSLTERELGEGNLQVMGSSG